MGISNDEVERQWAHVRSRDIQMLEASGRHRVLTKYERPARYNFMSEDRDDDLLGVVVDCESTGLDTEVDKMVEIAVQPFIFDKAGQVYSLLPALTQREDPGFPLPPEITELTGLTDADLAGQKFDDEQLFMSVADADLVIAHNAKFDRPMFERRFPIFAEHHWACSYEDVPWRKFGVRSGALDYILMRVAKTYHEEHRATSDVESVLHILAQRRPPEREAVTYLSVLLDAVRHPTIRLMPNTPYEARGALKSRGYRAQYKGGKFAYWYRDVLPEDMAAEEQWLVHHASAEPHIPSKRITAKDRYSVRA